MSHKFFWFRNRTVGPLDPRIVTEDAIFSISGPIVLMENSTIRDGNNSTIVRGWCHLPLVWYIYHCQARIALSLSSTLPQTPQHTVHTPPLSPHSETEMLNNNNPYPSTTDASITIYSPQTSTDDLICSLSPTSSLKGVFVRSRPTSTDFTAEGLGFDFGGFRQLAFKRTVQLGNPSTEHFPPSSSTPSDESEPISTPTTSSTLESDTSVSSSSAVDTDEEYTQKKVARRSAETRARVKALNHARAAARNHYEESVIAPSVKTTASTIHFPFGLGRHFSNNNQDIEEEGGGEESSSATEIFARVERKRSVYRSVTKKVYGVFHRKAHSTPESIPLSSEVADVTPIKSSSISLFTRKRRPTIDSLQEASSRSTKTIFSHRALSIRSRNNNNNNNNQQSSSPSIIPVTPNNNSNTVSLTSTSLAIENHASRSRDLRRSISFAAFADVQDVLPELDDELDEATAEATRVASKTCDIVRWQCRSRDDDDDADGLDRGVDAGYVFERNVE